MTPEQLGLLIDRHGGALLLYARQWCAAPEDVVQEAFIKLLAQRPTPEPVLPWLYRVVRNAAVSAARSEQRRQRHERAAARSAWFASDRFGSDLDSEQVATALQGVPLEQREVIIAHLWGELSFEEIARLVQSSASTVYRRYAAGIATLRERFGVACPR